jgi:hypothetical protein
MKNSIIYAINLPINEPLTPEMVDDLANPESPLVAITINDVVPKSACEKVVKALHSESWSKYSGSAASLASPIGSSAWDYRYNQHGQSLSNSSDAWIEYLDGVDDWDSQRAEKFVPFFGTDPNDIVSSIICNATGCPILRAEHPRLGRRMGAGMVRTGVPDPHFDWARYDLGLNATGHIGVVIPLRTGPNPVQRVWDHFAAPDNFGNYGIKIPEDTPYLDIGTPVGSVCLLSARRTHAVLDDSVRTTFAMHIAHMADGRWVMFA